MSSSYQQSNIVYNLCLENALTFYRSSVFDRRHSWLWWVEFESILYRLRHRPPVLLT